MSIYGSLAGASESGSRLPFLSSGVNGCRYALKFLGATQWEVKKNPKAAKGEWRCQFRVEVTYAEGDGATPVKTVAGILIMEDTQYFTYHLQDFRKVASAIFASNGKSWSESDQVATEALIKDLFEGKFDNTEFAAQISPNEKRPKFPVCTYFAITAEGEPVKTE